MTKLTEVQKLGIREVLKAKFSMGISNIVFEKSDGSIRTLRGTRDADVVYGFLGESINDAPGNRKESNNSVPVFDVEAEGWRSFSIDKLISVNGVKVEHLVRLIG